MDETDKNNLHEAENELNIPVCRLTLQFTDLCYTASKQNAAGDGTILKSVCGRFENGRLSVILGPSGSGKTSLLNVLSGFKYKNTTGRILLNGKTRNLNEFRKISSYIPQEFAMLDFLTTIETMYFAADLKLSRTITKFEKTNIIQKIMKLLNLDKCCASLVSKLSGGEKKRLSIGVELISNPPIMFFDEPTSGLDSVSALQILSHIRKLAQDGRMIVCVVHQPSSRLVNLFDDIFVLSDGRSLYNGRLDNLLPTLQLNSLICPNYYNIADYVLEVASKEFGLDCLTALIQNNTDKYFAVDESIGDDDENLPLLINESMVANFYNQTVSNRSESSFFWEFYSLTCRAFRSTWRDMMCTQLRIICHILVGLLIGIVFYQVGNDASKVLSNNSCLFFFVIFIFFANSMPSVLACPLETSVFLREHMNGWYSIKSYFFSKLISDIPLQVICPTVFVGIAYFMTGQPVDLERFSKVWLIGLLTGVLGHSLGLVSGSAFDLKLAVFLVPASCIPMLIFSGFFIRFNELSAYLRPLTYVSYFRYSLEGFLQSVYGNDRSNLTCTDMFCYYKSPKKLLHDLDMEKDVYLYDVLALVSWILFFQIMLYISLVVKVRKAQ